jgi:hypothetical protein
MLENVDEFSEKHFAGLSKRNTEFVPKRNHVGNLAGKVA